MKQNEDSLLHEKLKEYFGFSSFKGNQEAVIRNVLEWKRYVRADAYRRRQVPLLPAARPC